jgi:hypothetical protein
MTLVMGNKGMLDKIGALWNIAIVYGTSCWAYFQPVHHLLEVLLVVLLANFIARLIQSARRWKVRRSRKRRFSLYRWFREVRLVGILKEFFLSCFIVMTLCVIYKTLSIEEDDASAILVVTKYGVYAALVAYVMLFLNTIGEAFPDTYIVKVFKSIFNRVNILKLFGSAKSLPDDAFDDIKKIADDEVKDKS